MQVIVRHEPFQVFFFNFVVIHILTIHLQGPCGRGKLFYLDPEAGGAGCYCKQDWEAYYWAPLNQCFEQESPGPCQEGQYFAYNVSSRVTECNCFKNHVYSPSSQSCIELFTQGEQNLFRF